LNHQRHKAGRSFLEDASFVDRVGLYGKESASIHAESAVFKEKPL
jgi:hypothetical protein